MLPGANGGSEWSPVSIDPTLGYAFVAALHQPMNYIVHTAPWEKGRLWLGSAFVAIPGEEQYGLFSAIDLKTGKIAWQNKVPQPMMAARWLPPAASPSPVKATATSTPTIPRPASSCGSSTPARAATRRP
jgi:glucose dehydrogenase